MKLPRFHLETLLMCTAAYGILLGGNLRPSIQEFADEGSAWYFFPGETRFSHKYQVKSYGFPFTAIARVQIVPCEGEFPLWRGEYFTAHGGTTPPFSLNSVFISDYTMVSEVSLVALCLNLVFAIGSVAVLGLASERIILKSSLKIEPRERQRATNN